MTLVMALHGVKKDAFSEQLLSKAGHDAIVALNENEIKLLENMRSYVAKRAKMDHEYAQSMSKITINAINLVTTDSDKQNPIEKAWLSYVKECENKAKMMTSMSNTVTNSTVHRIDTLIREKKDLLSKYQKERARADTDYRRECDEVERLKKNYKDSAKDAVHARAKFVAKKENQDWKNARDKYCRNALKLHQNHNEYVFALSSANCHQHFYYTNILPILLQSTQDTQEQFIEEWKDIFLELFNFTNYSAEEFVNASARILETINVINPKKEYSNFITANKEVSPDRGKFIFEEELIHAAGECGELVAGELALNDQTLEKLQHKATILSQEKEKCKEKVDEKKTELSAAENVAKEECMNRISKIQKDIIFRRLKKELEESRCAYEKTEIKHAAATRLLDKLGTKDPPPFDTILDVKTVVANGKSKSLKPPKKKTSLLGTGNSTSLPRDINSKGTEYSNEIPNGHQEDDIDSKGEYIEPEISIEEEDFYHGEMDRIQATNVLVNDGDYLIRKSKGQYVLSARSHGDFKHFIVQQQEGLYRFEGEGFESIQNLIDYHVTKLAPVTKRSNTILLRPVKRRDLVDEFTISHSDVVIQEKLGQGHFGDVMKGYLKSKKIPVAVKTCKTTVQPQVKEKFLSEGDLLKQYSHPNIVKLYGICCDKEPIYIVMEFMPGGDFLNYLRKRGNTLTTKQLTRMSIDAAAGMEYLAGLNCIHRDLAARNCLIADDNVLKISDFGMSRMEDEEGCYNATNMREIPVKWTAPEALNYAQYTTKSDVWSFGILLWETFSLGNSPYPGMANRDTREKVEQGYRMPPPNGTPPPLYQIMMDCWKEDPQERPNFDEIYRRLVQVERQIRS